MVAIPFHMGGFDSPLWPEHTAYYTVARASYGQTNLWSAASALFSVCSPVSPMPFSTPTIASLIWAAIPPGVVAGA